jgi:hypothetical protein
MRTETSEGAWTGKMPNQHLIALRITGDASPWIYDGEKWLPFTPFTAYFSPKPAYIKGDVEFLVISDKK